MAEKSKLSPAAAWPFPTKKPEQSTVVSQPAWPQPALRVKRGYMDGTVFEYETGYTPVTVYPNKEAVLENNVCAPECGVVLVNIHEVEWPLPPKPLDQRIAEARKQTRKQKHLLKDDQIAKLVNELRDVAVQFYDHQSLRDRISSIVSQALKQK